MLIGNREIGTNSPTYFIADIAANHDGDLGRAKDLIFTAAESGADAAKFQHFQAATIVSDFGFRSLGSQKSHQANWGKSVFEVYRDASVDLEWTSELATTCQRAGIDFFSTPYSLEVVDHLDPLVPAYKIGSGDITWFELIEKIAKRGKPYFIAAGASSLAEVVDAVDMAVSINSNCCLMQCNTNYTASLENFKYIHLRVLETFKTLFPDIVLGLSDHTPGHATVLGAITLGARVVEKHFTDDVKRDGPDHAFSMDPKTWRDMVDRSRELEHALGQGQKKVEENELETVVLQRRAVRCRKSKRQGDLISRSDFDVLRPCPLDALSPRSLSALDGKRLSRNIEEGDYLRVGDVY